MKIKIKLAPGAQMPTRATDGSVGYDLYAYFPENYALSVPQGGRVLVPTGVYLEFPPKDRRWDDKTDQWVERAAWAEIRGRSGNGLKYGVTAIGSCTIDSDYRGELGVLLVNLGHDTFLVSGGDRVGQVLFNYVYLPTLDLVEDLEGTSRGGGGFGSTGV